MRCSPSTLLETMTMDPLRDYMLEETRRYFFGRMATGLGAAALGSLLNPNLFASPATNGVTPDSLGALAKLHHAPKAKRIIWLFMADGPSQFELFDYKPKLHAYFDVELPASVRMGQRITTMTSGQSRFPVAPAMFKFARHGKNGT